MRSTTKQKSSNTKQGELSSRTEVPVRFSEVDSLHVVWHGHYVKFLEDGREAFGNKYDLHYLDVYENGLVTPITNMNVDYKLPLRYGESAIIDTYYIDTAAAKIYFEYEIYRSEDHRLAATGFTEQVFLDTQYELQLAIPPYFQEWKKKWGLC